MVGKKLVYDFKEGSKELRDILGGKGAGLAEMTRIGLPVPPGFTISAEMCGVYLEKGEIPQEVKDEILAHLKILEEKLGKKLGNEENPLLVSVRSGAKVSMPGMMDTILNLGLNDQTIKGLASLTNDERFAYDSYRRFIQMFGDVVLEIPRKEFEEILERHKKNHGITLDTDISSEILKNVVQDYLQLVKDKTGVNFPQDPYDQLFQASGAVFRSWNNPRAIAYRELNNIKGIIGTAVNVQSMVFGNMGVTSATGVAFTRDPSTGENKFYGEYLTNAQGEDVVAGIRTPKNIDELQYEMPETYKQLIEVASILEKHYKDMQDMEFTVEKGKLYMLQTRSGKRTAQAAVKIAVDMVEEGLISKEEAVTRVTPEQLDQLLHRRIDPSAKLQIIAKGLPASPGAASGKVIFDTNLAAELGNSGVPILLVRPETTPEDIHGMAAAQGILTSRGGMTAHAAVVARGMGKPCIVGAEEIKIDVENRLFVVKGISVKENDVLTINGSAGEVILGEAPMIEPEPTPEMNTLLSFADSIRRLGVKANADTPVNARKAKSFGAEGIGLCRTERMFLDQERLPLMQEMIMAHTKEDREKALDKLLPFQRKDFEEMLEAMDGYPVIIRLLDPPLHEFLPQRERLEKEMEEFKTQGGKEKEIEEREAILKRSKELQEFNPMIGFRGIRVGIIYPEIYKLQVRAIAEATVKLLKNGKNPKPQIMLPLVGHINEIAYMKPIVQEVLDEVFKQNNISIKIPIGTMIEVPRAALTADEIAQYAEFFSYGTNDLTQTTFAYSRDDAEATFLPLYVEKNVLSFEPFVTIDQKGVGKLLRIGVVLGRKVNPNIDIGICGEHGGDPASIEFCHFSGLDYVSCSAYRVPIARLAAAHAVIKEKQEKKEAMQD